MRKKISVTQKDIDMGVQESCTNCPAAIACKREGLSDVRVFGDVVSYSNGKDYFHGEFKCNDAKVPRSLLRFIKRFDAGKPVRQFSFFLDIDENFINAK